MEIFETLKLQITNISMHIEQANSSIRFKTQFSNFYFAQILIKKAISDKSGLAIDNIASAFFFFEFAVEQLACKGNQLHFSCGILELSAIQ
jgi:hypothetical protein